MTKKRKSTERTDLGDKLIATIKVWETKVYDRFCQMLGNRDVRPAHVRKLQASLAEENWLPGNPIEVYRDGKDLVIYDGQNRFEAACNEDLPVAYRIIPRPAHAIKSVRKRNTDVEKWSLLDHAKSGAELGDANYRTLLTFHVGTKLPISACIAMLGGYRTGAGTKEQAEFKCGEFKVRKLEEAHRAVNLIEALYGVGIRWARSRQFALAACIVCEAVPDLDLRRIKDKLSYLQSSLVHYRYWPEHIEQLHWLYNYKVNKKYVVDIRERTRILLGGDK